MIKDLITSNHFKQGEIIRMETRGETRDRFRTGKQTGGQATRLTGGGRKAGHTNKRILYVSNVRSTGARLEQRLQII